MICMSVSLGGMLYIIHFAYENCWITSPKCVCLCLEAVIFTICMSVNIDDS